MILTQCPAWSAAAADAARSRESSGAGTPGRRAWACAAVAPLARATRCPATGPAVTQGRRAGRAAGQSGQPGTRACAVAASASAAATPRQRCTGISGRGWRELSAPRTPRAGEEDLFLTRALRDPPLTEHNDCEAGAHKTIQWRPGRKCQHGAPVT